MNTGEASISLRDVLASTRDSSSSSIVNSMFNIAQTIDWDVIPSSTSSGGSQTRKPYKRFRFTDLPGTRTGQGTREPESQSFGNLFRKNKYVDVPGAFANSLSKTKELLFEHDGSDPQGVKPWMKSGHAVELKPGAKKRIGSYFLLGLLGAAGVVGTYHQLTKDTVAASPTPIVQDAYMTIPGDDISNRLLDEPTITRGSVTLPDGTVVDGYHVNLDHDEAPEEYLVDKTHDVNEPVTKTVPKPFELSDVFDISQFNNVDYSFSTVSFGIPNNDWFSYPLFSFDTPDISSSSLYDSLTDPITFNSDIEILPYDPFGIVINDIIVEGAEPIIGSQNSQTQTFTPSEHTINFLSEISSSYNRMGTNFAHNGVEYLHSPIKVEKFTREPMFKAAGDDITLSLENLQSRYDPSVFSQGTYGHAQVVADDLGMSVSDVNKIYSFDLSYDSQTRGGQ